MNKPIIKLDGGKLLFFCSKCKKELFLTVKQKEEYFSNNTLEIIDSCEHCKNFKNVNTKAKSSTTV